MIHPRENHRGHLADWRNFRLLTSLLTVFLAFACQMALARGYENGGKLKFILKVVDDEGKPVESATVEVHLQTGLTIQGALFDTASDQKLKTDAEGRAVVSGKCVGEGNYLVRKDGFYSHRNRFELYDDKFEDGKWQPYGAERLVVLRKIRNPIRLHADYLENLRWLNHEPTPEEQTAIGKNKSILNFSWNGWLDLEAGDWIAPYGAGRGGHLPDGGGGGPAGRKPTGHAGELPAAPEDSLLKPERWRLCRSPGLLFNDANDISGRCR